MSDVEDFLAEVVPRQVAGVDSVHNGETATWGAMWSATEPVTLFGAIERVVAGADELAGTFGRVAAHFTAGSGATFEVLAAGVSGDLAYAVALEQSAASFDGRPVKQGTIRVTQVYRREAGRWLLVHRHGDPV